MYLCNLFSTMTGVHPKTNVREAAVQTRLEARDVNNVKVYLAKIAHIKPFS